jgi:hypothetical protein
MNDLLDGFDCDAPPEGYYSGAEQCWTIRPRIEYTYDTQRGWLWIGGPGVDGIQFGLLKGRKGVFAYYPIGGDYVWKADSVSKLMVGWMNGEITV